MNGKAHPTLRVLIIGKYTKTRRTVINHTYSTLCFQDRASKKRELIDYQTEEQML